MDCSCIARSWRAVALGIALLLSLVGCRPAAAPAPTSALPAATAPLSPVPTPQPSGAETGLEIGGWVLFHRKERTGWLNIYVLDVATQKLTALTRAQRNNYDPAWSPDGTEIAFISDRDPESTYGVLWLMNADGTDQRPLLPAGSYIELGPTWSPDGTHIAFESNRLGALDVLILDLASGELTNLTQDASVDANPTWSPDGQRIAFVSDREGSPDIWIVNVDGTNLRRLSLEPALGEWRPAWSPDGQRLIFESYSTMPPRDLLIQAVDGGEPSRLATFSVWNTWPYWVSDDVILYAASEEYDENLYEAGPAHLYVQRASTGERLQLTAGSEDDGRPSWRP